MDPSGCVSNEETVHHWPVVRESATETLVWDCGEYAIVIRPA
jgi:hypothetical protein